MQNSSVESTKFPAKKRWLIGDKEVSFDRPLVMGIINVTPDSFYDGSRSTSHKEILERVKEMLIQGAEILDLGAYSSRPGAKDISIDEERQRIVPVVAAIRKEFPNALLSVDTFRSEIARSVLGEGAHIINDISACSIDPTLAKVVADHKAPYVLMHMRGTPQTMQNLTSYNNLVKEVHSFFSRKLKELRRLGIDQILIDPGFGFSKTIEQNYELLHHLDRFQDLGVPLLAGLSRKSMIYKKLGVTAQEALPGTLALNAIALSKGASVLRVHDVAEHKELIDLIF